MKYLTNLKKDIGDTGCFPQNLLMQVDQFQQLRMQVLKQQGDSRNGVFPRARIDLLFESNALEKLYLETDDIRSFLIFIEMMTAVDGGVAHIYLLHAFLTKYLADHGSFEIKGRFYKDMCSGQSLATIAWPYGNTVRSYIDRKQITTTGTFPFVPYAGLAEVLFIINDSQTIVYPQATHGINIDKRVMRNGFRGLSPSKVSLTNCYVNSDCVLPDIQRSFQEKWPLFAMTLLLGSFAGALDATDKIITKYRLTTNTDEAQLVLSRLRISFYAHQAKKNTIIMKELLEHSYKEVMKQVEIIIASLGDIAFYHDEELVQYIENIRASNYLYSFSGIEKLAVT